MPFRRVRKTLRRTGAIIAPLACALSLLASVVGIPVIAPVAKDTSKPFPCAYRACGCRTADDCWKKCCCFSDAQKLAWARANGVTPPADFLARVHVPAPAKTSESPPACPYCAKEKPPAQPTPVEDPAETVVVEWVLAMEAAKCQSAASDWFSLKVSTPPPPIVSLANSVDQVTFVTNDSEPVYTGPSTGPTVPPPEV